MAYLEQGGEWKNEYWEMIRRAVYYTTENWQKTDSSIWEIPHEDHYVSSKVMSWVVLDRAIKIAGEIGRIEEIDNWQTTMETVHAEVMDRGWSDKLHAFRQRYGADTLDAAVLLIPVMDFLPADHPKVLSTVDQIVKSLTIDGFVHRFQANDMPDQENLPLGEFEGAFLPCTFWLATTYAKAGYPDEAEKILIRAESIAGDIGLFAEEVDARSKTFLGNSPLLFAQVEYIRAVMELAKARPLDKTQLMVGKIKGRISQLLSSEKSS